jgi:hypothetical protein
MYLSEFKQGLLEKIGPSPWFTVFSDRKKTELRCVLESSESMVSQIATALEEFLQGTVNGGKFSDDHPPTDSQNAIIHYLDSMAGVLEFRLADYEAEAGEFYRGPELWCYTVNREHFCALFQPQRQIAVASEDDSPENTASVFSR